MNQIKAIKVSDLHPFQDNPFKVQDDMEMEMLVDSVKEYGIITPLVVRPLDTGGYEIISGHRRTAACQKAGIDKIPAFVRSMDRDAAIVAMVDCNLQREHLLPSEKAFAYRMRLEAMKRQGYRTDLTSAQVGQKFVSVEQLAEKSPDSRVQIQRYIRLTYLEKALLDLVDEGRISLTPAVELSYLQPEEQNNLIETIESEDATPSLSQAQRMRKMSEAGTLDMDVIFNLMTEVKGNQKEVLKVPTERIRKYFKPNTSFKEMEETICKVLDDWYKRKQRDRDNAR